MSLPNPLHPTSIAGLGLSSNLVANPSPQIVSSSLNLSGPSHTNMSIHSKEVMSWDKDGNWKVFSYPFVNLLELFFEGKSLIDNRNDYIDLILKVPSVDGDNLKAVEYYERFARLMTAWELMATGDLQ